MHDNIIDLNKKREEQALLTERDNSQPETLLRSLDPVEVAMRLAIDVREDRNMRFSVEELQSMVFGLCQTHAVIASLCKKDRLNKGDLNFLFEAIQSPLTSIERFKNDSAG